MRHLYMSMIAAASFGFAVPAYALTATQIVEKEVVVTNDDGSETLTRIPAETVVPGERVVYSLRFQNDKAEPANDIVLTMPVPDVVTYMEGSAENRAANVTYSADGGQTFDTRASVMTKTSDGNFLPAKAADITHVRWLVAGPVAAGGTGELSFKGVLK